jgi:hypothetical protein
MLTKLFSFTIILALVYGCSNTEEVKKPQTIYIDTNKAETIAIDSSLTIKNEPLIINDSLNALANIIAGIDDSSTI